MLELSNSNFEETVKTGVAVVDFWAPWCGPCRSLKTILEQIAEEHDNIDVTFINIDDRPEEAELYKIRSLPTVMILKNDQDFIRFTGLRTKRELLDMLGL